MNEKISFSELYENMQAILDSPNIYPIEITQFSAGGLGACVYSQSITIAELVRCWQHKEYQIQCPNCGETAYITQWAGHANGGGYWEINACCPHCGKKHHLPRASSPATHHIIHWTKMRDVLQEERNAMKEMEKNDQGDSLTQRMVYVLHQENIKLRQEIQKKEQEVGRVNTMRRSLLKEYLESKRDVFEGWYADYCKKQEEVERELDDLKLQQKHLKQQLRAGEITSKCYQQQLTLLKRKICDVNNRFYNFGVTSLSNIVPKTYRRYLFPDDVIGFLNGEFEWQVVSMMSSNPTFTNIF